VGGWRAAWLFYAGRGAPFRASGRGPGFQISPRVACEKCVYLWPLSLSEHSIGLALYQGMASAVPQAMKQRTALAAEARAQGLKAPIIGGDPDGTAEAMP
jgi:hypothetical protein